MSRTKAFGEDRCSPMRSPRAQEGLAVDEQGIQRLSNRIHVAVQGSQPRPFSIYVSRDSHRLLNVPITKPLMIVVLQGEKRLGDHLSKRRIHFSIGYTCYTDASYCSEYTLFCPINYV